MVRTKGKRAEHQLDGGGSPPGPSCSPLHSALSWPVGSARYPYMAHLQEFERRTTNTPTPVWLQRVSTPLNGREWAKVLADHPDKEFQEYILRGINEGFRIGFNYEMNRCRPAASNMHSATEHSQIV